MVSVEGAGARYNSYPHSEKILRQASWHSYDTSHFILVVNSNKESRTQNRKRLLIIRKNVKIGKVMQFRMKYFKK